MRLDPTRGKAAGLVTAGNGDLTLARRLERAEAAANARFIDARLRHDPRCGAAWLDVAGAYALFDGVTSPLTQTFGLGLFGAFVEPQFERVEDFFTMRGAATMHEVCALAAPETTRLLSRRGYAPIEASTVLSRGTGAVEGPGRSNITVRRIGSEDAPLWVSVAARGWRSESAELAHALETLGLVMARGRSTHCFLAEIAGTPIAAAALNLSGDIAILAGASTVPEARNRGAQLALLQHRLAYAAHRGFDLAMIVAHPDTPSLRNAERRGFHAVYSRTKWKRSPD